MLLINYSSALFRRAGEDERASTVIRATILGVFAIHNAVRQEIGYLVDIFWRIRLISA